jgi:VWFA-related protein
MDISILDIQLDGAPGRVDSGAVMTRTMAYRTLVRCVLLAALAGLAAVSAGAQAQPAFKAGVDSVRLDTRVVTDDGGFVRGLSKDDFRVFEDGQEQTLTAFSMVELPPPVIDAGAALPSDVSSNASFRDGRVYLLVLDDLHIHELRAVTVRDLARRFIEEHTSAADRVAIATTSGLADRTQDFTNDRTRLFAAISRFKPHFLAEAAVSSVPQFDAMRATGVPPDPPPTGATPTELIPLQSLLSSVDWLGTIPERRKALVLIGEGIVDRSTDPEVEGTIREIVSAAARSNVAIYSVDAHGLPTGPSGAVKPVAVPDDDPMSEQRRRQQQGMRLLAEETGGAAVVNSNAFDPLFARVVSDSSAYYLLGYTSTTKPTKKLKRIEVRVARPGTTVQVRRGYGQPSESKRKRAASLDGLPPAINDAFQSPLPLTGFDLAVTSVALRGNGRGNRVSVAVIIESGGNREIDLFIGAAQNGEMQAVHRGALKPAKDSSAGGGMQATARLDLKPGQYHLRVAGVQKETGAQASVLHDFEVPDYSKENLSISTPALIDLATARTTTRRRFGPAESVDLAAEVYWKRGMKDSIDVAVTVANERGEEVYRQDGNVPPEKWTKEAVDVGTTLRLDGWQPGLYRITVEAKTTGSKPLGAKRELTFLVGAQ